VPKALRVEELISNYGVNMLHLKKYFSVREQQNLVEFTRNIAKANGGMTIPIMPNGAPFNCSQTSCGLVGWLSDRKGYRYSRINPVNNQPFAAMPTELIDIAQSLAKQVGEPDYSQKPA
jgi:alkylated DNA repair protein (DNA oxidative demethylase)